MTAQERYDELAAQHEANMAEAKRLIAEIRALLERAAGR